jgi:hypothetical protein
MKEYSTTGSSKADVLKSSGELLLKYTPNYIQRRPVDYPSHLSWPSGDGIVDGLAEISRLKYP